MSAHSVKPFLKAAFFCLFAQLFFSCASINPYSGIDPIVDAGDYTKAAAKLEAEKGTLYRDKDAVLYCLDYGMLLHFCKNSLESIKVLQRGEALIEAAYTKSISSETASYIANDNSLPYSGEDYEDIFVNVFNALNYYNAFRAGGNYNKALEEALVEVRRANHKMQLLSDRYREKPNFKSSALSRYLGMLFYRANNNYDDARIDASYLPADFQTELTAINNAQSGKASFNVIAFSGLVPPKEEELVRVWLPNLNGVQIALPKMGETKTKVTSVEIVIFFPDGQRQTHKLKLLEDIEEVARASFDLKKDFIYTKTVARASAKAIAAAATEIAAAETEGTKRTVLSIVSFFSKVMTFVERADLRLSHYFPSRAWASGFILNAGTYSFDINYYAQSKIVKTEHFADFPVDANRLNIAESFCLK